MFFHFYQKLYNYAYLHFTMNTNICTNIKTDKTIFDLILSAFYILFF